ncbi:MAG: hypothetical protein ABSA02_16000 [Trebonia sp.]
MALGRWHGLAAGAAVVAAAAVAVIILELLPGGSGPAPVRLSAAPLGVNIAPWDGVYAGSGSGVIQPLLAAAGIKQFRYGGGSYADFYDWQTNANIGNCLPGDPTASFTAGCASAGQLSFGQLSAHARAIGAESFVTVNYGSGTPALAAAWVTTAKGTAGEQVALWEVGNENYGCYEVNNPLASAPAHFRGYLPGSGSAAGQYQTCPTTTQGQLSGTKTLAMSYAANALPFLRAMKAADPSARLGVPWLLGTSAAAGAAGDGSSAASSEWNNTVLGTDGSYVGFVDAHYYPFSFAGAAGGGNPTDSRVLAALRSIPGLASATKTELAAHDPGAGLVIGETAVSSAATTSACTPVGAVFAAGDVLSWLAAGAQTVDWWDLNNYGNSSDSCTKPDYGFFTSAASPVPETAYYGYLLASALAKPGALLGPLTTSSPGNVLAFQSSLPGGAHAVALINLDTTAAHTVTFPVPAGLTGTLRSSVYSAGTQNTSNSNIVNTTAPVSSLSSGITLPAESITVLQTR